MKPIDIDTFVNEEKIILDSFAAYWKRHSFPQTLEAGEWTEQLIAFTETANNNNEVQ